MNTIDRPIHPNLITFSRIIMALLLLVVKPLSSIFYALYILCGLSDIADGYIARTTGQTSQVGARLDSLADLIMVTATVIVLYPYVILSSELLIWIGVIALVRLMSMLVSLMRFKVILSLHTYGNKLTGLTLFIYPLVFMNIDASLLSLLICLLASLSAIEDLAIMLTSQQIDVNIRSIFHP